MTHIDGIRVPGGWMVRLKAVLFDVGETVIDESEEYGKWADWLGVPRHTFSAVFGAVIARGGDPRDVYQIFKPGFDLSRERELRALSGMPEHFSEAHVYPDVRPCLEALRAQGIYVGLAGNQTARAGEMVRSLGLPVIGTSAAWGVAKPDPEFFKRLIAVAGHDPRETVYVGDRLDNDIRPAQQAGLQTAALRRGPWGYVLDDPQVMVRCIFRLRSLRELPDLIAVHNSG